MKLKFIIIALFILSFTFLMADTIIDTLYSTPELDGSITFGYDVNEYWVSTAPNVFGCGDGWGGLVETYWWERGYMSFYLPDIPVGYNIQDAYINLYQLLSMANGDLDVFPIWDIIPQPDTTECILDHIDYGYSLDVGDWTAGNQGDLQTLHSNIGIIIDNAVYEYKTMDITEYVMNDYDNGRDKTQYRIRFWINTDWDDWRDGLEFISGNWIENRPYLRLVFSNVNVIEESFTSNNLIKAYPNPFNPTTTISFSLPEESKVDLSIYNIKGQKIKSLLNDQISAGEHSIVWNGEDASGKKVSSGIYFYKLITPNASHTKKMLLLK